MSDANQPQDPEIERKKERSNLKKVGAIHFVALMAAVTLWGAADNWAVTSGWWLARGVAILNALIAATVVGGIVHEWGHYTGARLSGAVTQAFDKPINYFFMFNFPFDQNNREQFLWMSWGGILTPWLLVGLTLLFIPIDNPSRAMLLAVFVTRAAQASLFEVPVALRTAEGGEPQKELERRLLAGGLKSSRKQGIAFGVLAFLLA